MKKRVFCLMTMTAALATAGYAQTVTVAKSGTPNFATIQAAIDSFDPDPDAGTPNVIQITDNAVYKEVITIDVPVTIEGTNPNDRPIVVVGVNAATPGANDGILITMATGTFNDVTLRNLICIPDPAAPVTDDLIVSVGQNLNILFDNIVVTANNGSDAPVTLDGMVEADLTGATQIGDDGIFVGGTTTPAGDGTVVTFRQTVISQVGGDGIVLSGSGTRYIIEDGSVFNYNGRLGIQGNKDTQIDGSANRVWVVGNKGFAGIWYVGAVGATERVIDGVNVINNAGFGIEQQNGGDIPFILRNAIIAGNQGTGALQISGVGTNGAHTIENVTIARNGGNPIAVNAASAAVITITDSVILGDPTAPGTRSIDHNGTGNLDVSFSALVTDAGSVSRLASPPISGTGPSSTSDIVSVDPIFLEVNDFLSADYFDVDNPAYGGAGTAASDLSGGADYIGSFTEPTSVDDIWNLYL